MRAGETDVLVLGGGLAGLTVASVMAAQGRKVLIVERDIALGGRLSNIAHTFPSGQSGKEVLKGLLDNCQEQVRQGRIKVRTSTELASIVPSDKGSLVSLRSRHRPGEEHARTTEEWSVRAIVLATGLEPVDASQIPEFGKGTYPDVITSVELEEMLSPLGPTEGRLVRPSDGSQPRTLVFIQCVGSRVERRGVPYCSNICCLNAIKNAHLIRSKWPEVNCFILYIDIRTHGRGYEALYKEARKSGVRFIRGQPSLVRQSSDKRLLVCGENTLLKELYEIPADLVVLSVGLETSPATRHSLAVCGLELDQDLLVKQLQGFGSWDTPRHSVFLAGSLESPKDIKDTVSHARACADAVATFLDED